MQSSFQKYLDEVVLQDFTLGEKTSVDEAQLARQNRLKKFPYSVVLEVTYPKIDFADWLAWQLFGEKHERCDQAESDFSACYQPQPHQHTGVWTTYWLAKTDYDFGFNEWLFKTKVDYDTFLTVIPLLEQVTNFGIYEDEFFINFLKQVSDEVANLSVEEKFKRLSALDWRNLFDEVDKRQD